MTQATLEEVTRLADQLAPEEQRALMEHLSRRASSPVGSEPADAVPPTVDRPPRSLRGLWAGHFPEDLDVDALLFEIRHEWEKEGPELFEQ